MSLNPAVTLISPARNEGPFLLEWIAWHRMTGFDNILVLSHDCTDGSDRMLDALAEMGFIRHQRHQPAPGKSPLLSAYRAARQDSRVLASDWVMALDTDEFLQISVGNGTVQDLIGLNLHGYLGTAIYWKVFGSNGQDRWQDGFLRHRFTRAAETQDEANRHFKSLFRDPESFATFASHSPRDFRGRWKNKERWVDCEGRLIKAIHLTAPVQHARATHVGRITHTAARVNHYAVKSRESYALKATRLSGAAMVKRYDDTFFTTYDTNNIEDTSALAREADFAEEYARLTAHPDISAMHHACCAHYVTRLCEVAGTDPAEDSRFRHHRALAGAFYP